MRYWLPIFVNALAAVLAVSQASAGLVGKPIHAALERERITFLRPVLGPLSYTRFCQRYSDECRDHARLIREPEPETPAAGTLAELAAVNRAVNRSIKPLRHVNDVTFDTWRIAPAAGDCNDYAVTKRHLLMQRGWPSQSLLLSEVVTAWGEHHLVLVVRTGEADLVLDNLDGRIRPWTQVNYTWVRVQLPDEPKLWSLIKYRKPPLRDPASVSRQALVASREPAPG